MERSEMQMCNHCRRAADDDLHSVEVGDCCRDVGAAVHRSSYLSNCSKLPSMVVNRSSHFEAASRCCCP